MNTLLAVIIGALTVYLAYTLYARRIDRHVIQSDPKRKTPAVLYMDGVDFMPTNRNILFGYHFKSIAAAGPIIGAIVAANLWGWFPAIVWLILGVSFLGWASDYSGIVISVRNEGNSLSEWARTLPGKFADRVHVRLIDAASIEGFFKSLVHRLRRYPAFAVEGARYVGSDFARVDALIVQALRRKEEAARVSPNASTTN